MDDILLDEALKAPEKKPHVWYPSVFVRLEAFLADLFVVVAVWALLKHLGFFAVLPYQLMHLSVLVVPLVKCWMEWKYGGTFGKQVLGIVVVKATDKRPITAGMALRRNAVLFPCTFLLIGLAMYQDASLSSFEFRIQYHQWYSNLKGWLEAYEVIYGIGWCFMLFNASNRTLYDYMGGTVCVNKATLTASRTID